MNTDFPQERHRNRLLGFFRRIRFCSGLLMVFVIAGPLPLCVGAEIVDRIVAVVNDDIITYRELQQEIRPYAERLESLDYTAEKKERMLFQIRNDILNQLIEKMLTDQEIKRQNISVEDRDVERRIELIKTRNQMTQEALIAALASDGLDLAAYKKIIREQLLRNKLVNTEVKSKTVVTQEEIEGYYREHRSDFAGTRRYHLRNILMVVSPPASEDNRQTVREQMEAIHDLLERGAAFATLAKAYSDAPQADQGGDLGTFDFDDFSPQLKAALTGLDVGDYTPVMETDQGFQIFFIEEIQRRGTKTLEEAAPEIERQLFEEKVSAKFVAWMKNLRERSHIKIIQ